MAFMERSVAWTYLLGVGLAMAVPPKLCPTTTEADPRPPRLTGCVFLNRANVTCRWEAGDTSTTRYTLSVDMKPGGVHLPANSTVKTFTCDTWGTSCTADMANSTVRAGFCVTVTAHGCGQNVRSDPRCQPGRKEVMLPPAILDSVKPDNGRPQCLSLNWRRRLAEFPVSKSEIKNGVLNSQVEVAAEGTLDVQVRNVTVKDYSFRVCLFSPDTWYTVRLRHRYRGPESPWSRWSDSRQGRTAEAAPSAAPALWRQVEETDRPAWRLISLLWKALPRSLAHGRVLSYNATCQRRENTQVVKDHGSCRDLHHTRTSCTLLLPAEGCSCTLTASNSAGTSPEGQIWLLGASETEPPAPSTIAARPLDDGIIRVSWSAPANRSVSGFVLEWFALRENNSYPLHWERLNSSQTSFVITEGVKPMERYAVSVTALYGERGAGRNTTLPFYTRQGAPSAGPNVAVQQIHGGTVELCWSPVPVELLHGFLRNYTLCYTSAEGLARSVLVPGHVHRFSLVDLSPGNYDIYMQANTDAGTGAAGPVANVHIGSEEISIMTYAILSVALTTLTLALMACVAQNRVKNWLCQFIPDPSKSSVAHWTPKTFLEFRDLTDQDTTISEKRHVRAEAASPCLSIYPRVVLSPARRTPAAAVWCPSYHQSTDRWSACDVEAVLPGGDEAEAPQEGSSVATSDSLSDCISPSSVLLSPPAGFWSLKHLYHQDDNSNSGHPLPHNSLSYLPLGDFSYCSAECDPHTYSAA